MHPPPPPQIEPPPPPTEPPLHPIPTPPPTPHPPNPKPAPPAFLPPQTTTVPHLSTTPHLTRHEFPPWNCPTDPSPDIQCIQYTRRCTDDYSCSNQRKCCKKGCNYMCLDPVY